jgi:AraC-like DNA-binding protein
VRDVGIDLAVAYHGVPVLTDQRCAALEFPRTLLCSERSAIGAEPAPASGSLPDETAPSTLAETLEACIYPYLADGAPHIGLAAEIAGCGTKSLQRKLAVEGASYKVLVDNVRCRYALWLLRSSPISVSELALKLGYSEHSAFTRAFRRWTATSPSDYRARAGCQH